MKKSIMLVGIFILIVLYRSESQFLEANKAGQTTQDYKQIVNKIQQAILSPNSDLHHASYERLAVWTDTYGPRLWGSEALQMAIDDLYNQALDEGFDNVRKEQFTGFERWTRLHEELTLYDPRPVPTKLRVIGLGRTIPGNVTAEVVVVRNYDELDKLGTKASGKIVCFFNEWTTYGQTVEYRVSGASRAAKYGAAAVLIRSVTPYSIESPHTGIMHYQDDVKKIPAAAITVEDAEMFWRMQNRGQQIVVNLFLDSQTEPNASSSNLVAEIQGSTNPEQVILLGGHIDSWDTGSQTGANDDGGGVMTCFEAVRTLIYLGFRPQRTIRFIAWSGEEFGDPNNGAQAYFKQHQNELKNHIAAFESDLGSTWIYGFGFSGGQNGYKYMDDLRVNYLSAVNITTIVKGGGGADIEPLFDAGVPMIDNQIKDNSSHDFYFTYHHSGGDSMSMMNPDEMDSNVIAMSALVYLLADLDTPLPRN